jgi:glutathione S-transferase
MLTLYSTPLSANGRKVLALSRHLGLAPKVRLVDVYRGEGRTPEYLAINPTGKVPCLVENGFTLSESNAILQYLSEAHGGLQLCSGDPKERAAISSWLFWESAHWQPALVTVLSAFVGHALLPETVPAPSEPPDWNEATLRPLLDRLEAHLGEHPHLALDALTIADFSVGGMVTYFRAAAFPFEAFPNLATWYGRLEGLEAWKATEAPVWAAR